MPEGGRTRNTSLPRRDIEEILALMADEAKILHSSWSDQDRGSGGDIDCAVSGVDEVWPLRLDPHTKFCQCLEYDLNARYWILDRDGTVLAIDAIEDPHGLGKYGFPTSLVMQGEGILPAPGVRAAYLSVKRIKKRVGWSDEWARVSSLAREDPTRFEDALVRVLGSDVGARLTDRVLAGSAPDERLAMHVMRAVAARRRRSPRQAAVPVLRLLRAIRRATHPTGLLVTIVGPDGTGKSTVTRMLPDTCRGLFRREALFHWRPGVLPRPGALIGPATGDPADPHGRPPHGKGVSAALLLYYWGDFFIGSWTRFYVLRAKTGLVLLERGWWDILVDPRRYRLDVPPRLVAMLGMLLPSPDLTLLCDVPVEILLTRKSELPSDELSRQTQMWRSLRAKDPALHVIDASVDAERMVGEARSTIIDHLEARAAARLARGWAGLPSMSARRGAAPRWSLPRGPARAASSSLLIYQPTSSARRVVWEVCRWTAGLGGFRLLPRGASPPRAVRELLSPFIPARGAIAVARANHAHRFFALILDRHGDPSLVVKVATDGAGIRALEREATHIDDLGPLLSSPLRPPLIIDRGPGVLALRAERWRARWRPWQLEDDAAWAMGRFFAAGRRDDADGLPVGPAHGDFAPWNLLKRDDDWVLIDWEHAAQDRPAFYDVFHHLVQTHVLVHRPARPALLGAIVGRGPMARTLRIYAEAAGVDVGRAPDLFRQYTRLSEVHLDPARADGRAGLDVRSDLDRWVASRS